MVQATQIFNICKQPNCFHLIEVVVDMVTTRNNHLSCFFIQFAFPTFLNYWYFILRINLCSGTVIEPLTLYLEIENLNPTCSQNHL
jgi:hypothetical protein